VQASLPRKSIQVSGSTMSINCRRSVHQCLGGPSPKTTAAQQLAAALERHQDLRLTRVACGKLERALPARMRENGATEA
jgi:hypothetical protein